MSEKPASFIGEQGLWNSFRLGDKDAFAELYQRYVRVVYNYEYHFVAEPDLLQNAIQDLFVDLWRRRETLYDILSNMLPAQQTVRLKAIAEPLETVLRSLLKPIGLDYDVEGRQIVLSRPTPNQPTSP